MWSLGGRTRLPRRSCAIVFAGAIALVMSTAATAHADDVQAARQAYDRGAAAYDAGDYGLAVSELARADELFANDVALELALKAAVKADDARMAVRLALRADTRTRTGSLAAAAAAAREKMAGRTGTITITCPGRASCAATIDAGDVPAGGPYVVLAGVHRVTVQGAGGPREAFDARVEPGASVEVKSSAPPAVPLVGPVSQPGRTVPAAESPTSGISPVWFWVGLGVTAALGGAAIASAVDTQSKHDEFKLTPSTDLQDQGLNAQLRTNLLAGGTAFGGLATALVGVFLVRWTTPPSTSSASSAPVVR
jgi:hypothetical protein